MSPHVQHLISLALLSIVTAVTPTVSPTQGPPAPKEIERGRELRALDEAANALAAGKPERAELLLQSVVDRAPDLEVAWYQLGVARLLQGKSEAALAAVDKALACKADFPEARILWIELSVEREPDRCREFVRELLKHAQAPALRRPLLPHMITLRMFEESEDALKGLREEAPKDVELLELLSRCQIEAGKPEAAAKTLEEKLAIEPKDPLSLQTLATLYEVSGAGDKVLPTLERLVEVNPSNVAARKRVIEMLTKLDPASPKLTEHRRLVRHYQRRSGDESGAPTDDKKTPPPAPPKGGR